MHHGYYEKLISEHLVQDEVGPPGNIFRSNLSSYFWRPRWKIAEKAHCPSDHVIKAPTQTWLRSLIKSNRLTPLAGGGFMDKELQI